MPAIRLNTSDDVYQSGEKPPFYHQVDSLDCLLVLARGPMDTDTYTFATSRQINFPVCVKMYVIGLQRD